MRKHRTRRLQHSTTFHCSEDFCSTTIPVRTLLPPCYAPNKVPKKRPQRNPPPFYLSRFQGEPRLPRVGYLNLTTGLMATTPFPGVTRSQTHRLAAHCVVLFFLPLWGGFDQSLISSHCRSQSSFFACAHQPGVDFPSSTNRRPPLLSTTLRRFTSLSLLYSLATVT